MQPRYTCCVLQLAQQLPVPLLHEGIRWWPNDFAAAIGWLLPVLLLRICFGCCKLLLYPFALQQQDTIRQQNGCCQLLSDAMAKSNSGHSVSCTAGDREANNHVVMPSCTQFISA